MAEITYVEHSFFRTVARDNGTVTLTAIGATTDHGDASDITDFVLTYLDDLTELVPGVTMQSLVAGGEMEWSSDGIITLLLMDETDNPLKQAVLQEFLKLSTISGRFRPTEGMQAKFFAYATDVTHVVDVTVDATGGSWDLTVDDGTTSETAVLNATDDAATVQAAVEALSHVGAGNVAVSGGPGDDGGTTPYSVSIDPGDIAATPTITVADNGGTPLTGGASTVDVAVTTQGRRHGELPSPSPIVPPLWWHALDYSDPADHPTSPWVTTHAPAGGGPWVASEAHFVEFLTRMAGGEFVAVDPDAYPA